MILKRKRLLGPLTSGAKGLGIGRFDAHAARCSVDRRGCKRGRRFEFIMQTVDLGNDGGVFRRAEWYRFHSDVPRDMIRGVFR